MLPPIINSYKHFLGDMREQQTDIQTYYTDRREEGKRKFIYIKCTHNLILYKVMKLKLPRFMIIVFSYLLMDFQVLEFQIMFEVFMAAYQNLFSLIYVCSKILYRTLHK